MKIFYGSNFIDEEELKESNKNHLIKLEYYKRIDKQKKNNNNIIYGVSIIKTEYMPNDTKIEEKYVKYLTKDEEKIEDLLEILKKFKVMPITLKYIIQDLKKQNQPYEF